MSKSIGARGGTIGSLIDIEAARGGWGAGTVCGCANGATLAASWINGASGDAEDAGVASDCGPALEGWIGEDKALPPFVVGLRVVTVVFTVVADFVRVVAGLRVGALGAAFLLSNVFCFSFASCCSFVGIFNLTRCSPDVISSISFSLSCGAFR
jgi:hypothetical protein